MDDAGVPNPSATSSGQSPMPTDSVPLDPVPIDPVPIDPGALYVAPNGAANAAGSLDEPTTLSSAVSKVSAGGTIYLRGGTYALDATISLTKDGSSDSPVTLSAYPLDATRPTLDFSAMAEDSSNRGFILSGDYWYVYGIDVRNAGDNCMFISGSHNTVEFSTFSECADTGLQLGGGASENLLLNCDSFFNADSALENADGFAAKLDVGTGNRFVGCRAWNNLDDGWDGYLRPADNITTTYERCWAIDNGKLKSGSVGAGDGNGFKTGGSDDKNLSHHAVYTQCIAAGNVTDGFDHNSNRGRITIVNSAAHGNGSNFNFSTSNIAASLTIQNSISLGTNGSLNATTTSLVNNSWQDGRAATNDDFESVDMSALKAPRKSDGSLPDITYLKLKATSDLRNAGTDVGLSFEGSAPDLGPFESEE
jgi:Right handed beta helix region